jgi:hypothetical protein
MERPAAGMISPQQHKKLMKEYEKSGRIGLSAAKAGVDRGTAAKYIAGAPGPLEWRPQRGWRTHEDAFASVWPEVERRLAREPRLKAKTLWEELVREHGEKFRAGQRRSFERRVRAWKDGHGTEPEVFFAQEHRAGERPQIDWVDCKGLGVRVCGEDFYHKLVHVVLPYSNWGWARACRSESLLSLKMGLQSAVWELGGVPLICQSDNSSTATHERGGGGRGREYNARYLSVLAYYGMKPALIGVGEAHQNGDVESAHNHLVRAIDQGLMLRGSREFYSVEDYEGFVAGIVRTRNAGRGERLEKERAQLQRLPEARLPEYEEEEVLVSREAIARGGKANKATRCRRGGPVAGCGRELVRPRSPFTTVRTELRKLNGTAATREFTSTGGTCCLSCCASRAPLRDGATENKCSPRGCGGSFMIPCLSISPQGGPNASIWVCSPWASNTAWKRSQIILRLGVSDAGLDTVRRELNAANKVVIVDFRADLSSYDAMIAAASQQEEELHHG